MEQTMGKLNGKTALITGGSTGIGRATAQCFIAEGAKVFITGRRQAELDRAVAEIGGDITGICSDVSNLSDLDHVFTEIRSKADELHILFANAGTGALAPLGSISESHFDTEFDTNVKGTLFTVQKALPLLVDGASVILGASSGTITGNPAFSVYAASKAAVRSFARSWILDLKARHIRINVLSPGPTDTPMLRGVVGEDQVAGMISYLESQIPLGRIGSADEIAKAALFLASDDSSFVNGIELFVDGGMAQI
jgi:NAD(P)-dependent dehydrogenase (short-subunit alcohol dehydrogenase family)